MWLLLRRVGLATHDDSDPDSLSPQCWNISMCKFLKRVTPALTYVIGLKYFISWTCLFLNRARLATTSPLLWSAQFCVRMCLSLEWVTLATAFDSELTLTSTECFFGYVFLFWKGCTLPLTLTWNQLFSMLEPVFLWKVRPLLLLTDSDLGSVDFSI